MDVNLLMQSIENLTDRYVDFLCDICSFEARARDKETLDAMLDHVTRFAHAEGFATHRTPMVNCGDFLSVDMNEGAAKSCEKRI